MKCPECNSDDTVEIEDKLLCNDCHQLTTIRCFRDKTGGCDPCCEEVCVKQDMECVECGDMTANWVVLGWGYCECYKCGGNIRDNRTGELIKDIIR